MQHRNPEDLEEFLTKGGVRELCRKLNTDPIKGLDGSANNIEHRRRVFGSNVMPLKPPKSFFKLVWEALQDVTLIILIVAAIISLGLSFYKPPGGDKYVREEDLYKESGGDIEEAAGWIDG